MKNLGALFCICLLVLGFSHCKNSVEPDDKPGRRDYTWVADTIKNPFLHFSNIWGNALDNIWTTGALSSDAVYKYSGKTWILDNRVYIPAPRAIWGNGNGVWIGNYQGCIWKFINNYYMEQLKDFKIDGNLASFGNMAGSSENEIYVIGSVQLDGKPHPIMMKYDGNNWILDKKLSETGGFNDIKYCSKNGKYYLLLWLTDYSVHICEYDGHNLKIIYDYPPTNAGPTISEIDGYAYFVIDKKIFRYYNDSMESIFEVSDANFGGHVWGRNRNDIFIRMQDGLAHYNGTDIKYLFKSLDPIMMAPNSTIFEKDIFIPAQIENTGYNIIYHGTLK